MAPAHRRARGIGAGRHRGTALAVALGSACLPVDAARALDLGVAWTGDFATVLDGGLRHDTRHMGLVEATLDHGFEVGGRAVDLHLAAQHIYGGGFSATRVGDLQTVSNIDADTGTRLFEAWLDVPIATDWSARFGRYDLNSEFDAIDAAALFLNSSQGIGPDISQTGAAGPSIFPRTALGLRVQYQGAGGLTVRGVALDVESDPDAEYDDTPFVGGPMFALEGEFGPETTRATLGAWCFTRSRPGLTQADDRDREYGAYGAVAQRWGEGWLAYVRAGVANAEVSRLGGYLGAGVVHEGGVLRTHDDTIGFSVGHARNGSTYRDLQAADGVATTAAETALELTWRIPVGEHVVLQPDLQYVIDPDTDPTLADALVAILRVDIAF